MLDDRIAQQLPIDWIEAWNNHDPDRILWHIADNFEMWAPANHEVSEESSAVLKGKDTLAAHWSGMRRLNPELRFQMVTAILVRDSLTLYYNGIGGRLAAETFFFGPDCKVCKMLTMLGEFLPMG